MTKYLLIFPILMFMLSGSDKSLAQDGKLDKTLEGLIVESPAERRNNVEFIAKNHQQIVQQLIILASKKDDHRDVNSSKELAIELLGELRASESAQMLVDQIALKVPVIVTAVIPFQDFPALRALIKIGNPSIEAIFRRLSPLEHLVELTPLGPHDLHLFALVIREVDGEEVGLFRLQLVLKNAKTEKQKKNFSDLIEIYKKKEDEFDIKDAILADKIKEPTAPTKPQPK